MYPWVYSYEALVGMKIVNQVEGLNFIKKNYNWNWLLTCLYLASLFFLWGTDFMHVCVGSGPSFVPQDMSDDAFSKL